MKATVEIFLTGSEILANGFKLDYKAPNGGSVRLLLKKQFNIYIPRGTKIREAVTATVEGIGMVGNFRWGFRLWDGKTPAPAGETTGIVPNGQIAADCFIPVSPDEVLEWL